MSYQFEDDSALEELLNQQLDRRVQQSSTSSKQTRNSNRPTGIPIKTVQEVPGGEPSAMQSAFRPSTASSLFSRQPIALEHGAADELASSLPLADGNPPPKGKSLSSWLQGRGSSSAGHKQRTDETRAPLEPSPLLRKAPDNSHQRDQRPTRVDNDANIFQEVPREKISQAGVETGRDDGAIAATLTDLDHLLSPSSLQEMSKQRLIQVVQDEVVPRLNNLKGLADRESAREVERLKRELHLERNRLEVIEMRQEEQLKLERQKWQQINQQLESRLATGELQMSHLLESQKDHLNKLDEQYQKRLTKLTEMFEQRLNDEKTRFEEMLKSRDELHKLELEGRLNVNCDLMKLDTLQMEWRKTLEMTINQLSDHYKSVEALLEKQAIQVNGTNLDLVSKSQRLCDQYDNFDRCNQRLGQLTTEMGQIIPKMAEAQIKGESVLEGTEMKLAELNEKLNNLLRNEKLLEEKKMELLEMSNKLNEDKHKLALDSNRVSMKEERLNELLNQNSENELRLTNERKSLSELETQLHQKRLSLDERFADLKEQNYTLHLLRKRLTAQKEELLKAQLELAEERKSFKSNKTKIEDESRRLGTLRVRVQQELDQLRRLQTSLVCSLCMSRLFDGPNANVSQAANNNQEKHYHATSQRPDLAGDIIRQFEFEQLPEAQFGHCTLSRIRTTLSKVDRGQMETELHSDEECNGDKHDNDVEGLDVVVKRTELERSRLVAESKYVEQLFGSGFA
jgi:hypothetical protein